MSATIKGLFSTVFRGVKELQHNAELAEEFYGEGTPDDAIIGLQQLIDDCNTLARQATSLRTLINKQNIHQEAREPLRDSLHPEGL